MKRLRRIFLRRPEVPKCRGEEDIRCCGFVIYTVNYAILCTLIICNTLCFQSICCRVYDVTDNTTRHTSIDTVYILYIVNIYNTPFPTHLVASPLSSFHYYCIAPTLTPPFYMTFHPPQMWSLRSTLFGALSNMQRCSL